MSSLTMAIAGLLIGSSNIRRVVKPGVQQPADYVYGVSGNCGVLMQGFAQEADSKYNRPIIAWLSIGPVLAVLIVALFVVAPRLIHQTDLHELSRLFCPPFDSACKPETLEQARYILAISVVPFTWLVMLFFRTSLTTWFSKRPSTIVPAIFASQLIQLAVSAFLIFNLGKNLTRVGNGWLFCIIVTFALLMLFWLFKLKPAFCVFLRQSQSPLNWILPIALAAIYTVTRLLPSIVINLGSWILVPAVHLKYSMSEFAAVLSGKTVLVNFFPQYQNLSEYLLAPIFMLYGLTPFTFSLTMTCLTCVALALIFRVLFLCTNNFWATFVLYIPVCSAITFPMLVQAETGFAYTPSNLFSAMPLRYFGPFLVTYFCCRYLQKPNLQRMIVLFLVGAAVALNNLDFGIPAFVAALATVLLVSCNRWRISRKALVIPVFGFSFSLLAILVLYCMIAVCRTHQLPQFNKIFEFQKVFAVYGFNMLPMPDFGEHCNVYATFMAGCLWSMEAFRAGVVDVRMRTINGLLFFTSVAGCGPLMYFVGRSHPDCLVISFAAWSLVLCFLLLSVRESVMRILALSKRPYRFMLIGGAVPLAILLAPLLLLAANMAAMPRPSVEYLRIKHNRKDDLTESNLRVANYVRQEIGARRAVCIIHPYGHMVAKAAGVANSFPFTCPISVFLEEQLNLVWDSLKKDQVRDVFLETVNDWHGSLPNGNIQEQQKDLSALGYRVHCAFEPEPWSKIEHWVK